MCISITIQSDGKQIKVGKKKSRIKPRTTCFIKVFDKDKNVVFKNKANFGSLEGIITLNSPKDALSPENIYKI